ncbi:MAG TPA: ABC-2 family transporter protein [Ktedonobacterales bacterium]|nr:ABC-2 family transporter protein [Ktedonobacterales bacterium]
MRSYLRFLGGYLSANLQAAMEYRAGFWSQVASMALNDGLWLGFWFLFFQRYPVVQGWVVSDIIIVWAVPAAGFGLATGIFGRAQRLASVITSGGLDSYLTMPKNVLLHVLVSATSASGWGDLIFGLVAFTLLIRPTPFDFLLYLALVLMVAIIFTAFLVLLGSLAFWLGNSEGLSQQLMGALISFSTYPTAIFHGAVKLLLFTVLPAGFISYFPVELLRSFRWPLLGALFAFTVGIAALAWAVFHLGLRRYESGNRLGAQAL